MKILTCIAAAAALIPIVAQAGSGTCFKLGGDSYCRAWSAKDSAMMKTEFLRSGETVDRWQNMVTVIRYNNVHTVKGAIANGLTKDEIREVLLQVAIYCGIPAGVDSFRIAKEALAEIGK